MLQNWYLCFFIKKTVCFIMKTCKCITAKRLRRVIEFNQTQWLKTHVKFNTKKGKLKK